MRPERDRCGGRASVPPGFSLIELVTALAVAAVLAAATLPALGALERWSLARGASLAERHLMSARLGALSGRERLRVRLIGTTLETVDPAGRVKGRVSLDGDGFRALDSARLHPATLRYNARGQGSAGSLYLYRGRRGIRVVSNFVGRIRSHPFSF